MPDAVLPEAPATLPVKHRGLLMAAVMGASVVQFLDATIANVALPHMQTSLGASFDTVTWVLTSYLVASVVAMPVAGWLADRIGSRRLFIMAVAGFIVASMLCGIAANLGQMVTFRVLQGFSAAFIGPMSQSIMFDISTPKQLPKAMMIWGVTVMIGPISGPLIGGILTDSLSWRWCFYVNLPIGIPTLAVLWWLLPSRPIVQRRLDYLGFIMLAVGLGTLQLMLDRGQQQDWFDSWEIRVEAIIAASALWVFVVQMVSGRHALFDRSLLTNRNYMVATGFQMMMGVIMVGLSALLPPMMQSLYHYSVVDSGLMMGVRGLGTVASMLVVTRLGNMMDLRILLLFAYALMAGSLWQMTGWTPDMDWHPFVICSFLQGLGIGLTFIPLNLLAFATVAPQYRTDGASLLNLARSIGASCGISMLVALLARNIQTVHSSMSGDVTAASMPAMDPSALGRIGPLGEAALRMMDGEINRQAAMIAYLDDFKLMLIVVLLFMPTVLFLRPPKVRAGEEPQMAMAE
jgi:MFS transporter, DHA2 family, multidrug resistance protein